ncbi:MAG: nitroreductase family protein [Methanoregula sp.]|jgi:nitroreductase|uniref:nitroreductase family protein n=1 Tax=Methanoregula sp. TaxID=2052170 RepID=UPI003C27096B
MEFKDIVMQRYATKQFDGRMIDEQKLFALLDIIRYSPSAFNLQPWKIKVVTASKIKSNLRPHANDQPQITTCSHLLVFCANTELEHLVEKVVAGMEATGIPNGMVQQYAAMMKGYIGSMSPEQRMTFAREQIHIALGNAVNGAKSLGIDSCPMGGFDPVAFAEVLFLPDEYVPVVLCAVGYAVDKPHPKWRLPREEVFF